MGIKSKPGDGIFGKGMKGGKITFSNGSAISVIWRLVASLRSRPSAR